MAAKFTSRPKNWYISAQFSPEFGTKMDLRPLKSKEKIFCTMILIWIRYHGRLSLQNSVVNVHGLFQMDRNGRLTSSFQGPRVHTGSEQVRLRGALVPIWRKLQATVASCSVNKMNWNFLVGKNPNVCWHKVMTLDWGWVKTAKVHL